HEVEAAGRGHLDRTDPAVLPAARGGAARRARHRPGGRARRAARRRGPAACAGAVGNAARGRTEGRDAAGSAQAGKAAAVRRQGGHPLRGNARGRRGRSRHGGGQGPAQRRTVRGGRGSPGRAPARGGRRMKSIVLDGKSLTRHQLVAVAGGATVALDPVALEAVARAADFLAGQVRRAEPIYGVSTGFGSNADKLPGGHPLREPAPDVVRAMLCIRLNTLLRGHSGIRVQTLQAMAAMLNAGVVPIVPQLGSVGASGDLAPLSHLAIVLLGGGEAWYDGERMHGDEALRRAGLSPRSEEHTSELQSRENLVCRLLL